MPRKMIKCPACDMIVSSRAASCPHCGEPIVDAKRVGLFSGTLIIASIVLLLIVIIGYAVK